MDIQTALKSQYHAALAMLRQTIEHCPQHLWRGGDYEVPYWQVVYHTLYFTDLYLHQTAAEFTPWEHHRKDYDDLPWPPGSGPKLDHPYTPTELLEYWQRVDGGVDAAVDRLDFDARSGFPWHEAMPKLDHQLHNIRHIQHHAALLSGRLKAHRCAEVTWVRPK